VSRIVGDSLDFRVLGEVEVLAGRGQVCLGHARRRTLLAVLLAEAGRVVSTDQIIDRIWGERAPASARNIVSGYATRLRAALQEATGDDPPLRRQADGYLVSVDAEAVDLHRFRRLAVAARCCPDPGEAAALLGRALELWRGPTFAGLVSPYLEHLSEVIEEELWSARLDHADLLLTLGHHTGILPSLRAWAEERPMDERLAGQFMTGLYQAGQQAEAIAWFHQIRERLADQLGVDPSPQLGDVYQRILRGDAALAGHWETARADRSPAPSDLCPPPGCAEAWTPAELPHDIRNFIGRTAELARLDALLAAYGSAHGVFMGAIEGPAGIVHWAHQIAGQLPDGQLYVNLRGHDHHHDPMTHGVALTQLLRSLGAEPGRIPADPGEQANLYRSMVAGRRMLLLLDNAASPGQIRPLLPGTASCVVLVTSRKSLTGLVACEGAHPLSLDRLGLAESVCLLRSILGNDRVAAEPEAAGTLSELCGHMPLALRIAAANLACQPYRTIADAVAELAGETRLTALTPLGDDRMAVGTALGLSYQALPLELRQFFRRLGLVPGPHVTPQAAAALIQADPELASRFLNVLAAAHLVERHGRNQYRFHDLIRLYARERALAEEPSQQRREVFRRVLRWYVHAITAAVRFICPDAPGQPGPRADRDEVPVPFSDRDEALAWLRDERPNLVAAVGDASAMGCPEARQLADALTSASFTRRTPVLNG
jgi:DNA-binding SARP family transcriptional activator